MLQFSELDATWRKSLFDENPVAMALVAGDHRFLRCNDAYCRLVGFGRSELLHRTWQSITHPDDVEGDSSGAESLKADPSLDEYTIHKRYLAKSGDAVWANLYVRAVRDEDDKFLCYFIIAIPIQKSGGGNDSPESKKPQGVLEWVKRNPKDAALLGGAAIAIFGRDSVIEVVKALLLK